VIARVQGDAPVRDQLGCCRVCRFACGRASVTRDFPVHLHRLFRHEPSLLRRIVFAPCLLEGLCCAATKAPVGRVQSPGDRAQSRRSLASVPRAGSNFSLAALDAREDGSARRTLTPAPNACRRREPSWVVPPAGCQRRRRRGSRSWASSGGAPHTTT
jgi:hypothetical protein